MHYGFSLKYCGSAVVCSLGEGPGGVSQDHRPAHVDVFTQLSSNKFCSTVKHIVNHKTPSLLAVVAVAVLMLKFLPQLNTEKVDLIVHGKMSFLGCLLPQSMQ